MILDVRCITWKLLDPALGFEEEEIYVDDAHPAPWVYFELNQLRLNLISSWREESKGAE